MRSAGYDALFAPSAIAIVGASSDQRKFGNRTIRILQRHRFAGPIYAVHGREQQIEGLTAYPSLERLPGPPILTVICVPAAAVPAAVDQVCAAGARAIVVHSSGFRETGAAGSALEAAVVQRCRESGVVLLGPNCQGSANFHNGAVVNFSIAMLDEMAPPSGLAVVGQSGLLGTVLTESLRRHGGVQAGMLVATGNEAEADTLSLASDLARSRPEVTGLLLHIENVGSLAALESLAAAAAESGKPVCILKVGRTAAGGRAAASHTGSMPVDERVFESACARLGLRQVRSIEEAARAGRLMVQAPRDPRRGARVAIVSNSGGVAALFADLVSDAGLAVATLTARTQAALAEFLPGQEAGGFNPSDVNVLPYTDPARYARVLQIVADDPDVDQVLLFLGMQRSSIEPIARAIGAVQRAAGKPVLACTMGCSAEIAGLLRAEGIVAVEDSAAAVEYLRLLVATPPLRRAGAAADDAPVAAGEPGLWTRGWDRPHNSVFADAGVDVLATLHVPGTNPDDVAAAAGELGYPVALKIHSARQTHKSDVGGVHLGVANAEQLRALCSDDRRRLGELVEGFLVQRMCPFAPVAEIFLGFKRDRVFGNVVLLGSGGVHVNDWNDACVVADPQDAADVEAAVDRLVMRPLLRPRRGNAGADIAALARLVGRAARLFAAMPAAVEVLEFNPVLLGRPGEGAWVADWRIDQAGGAAA